MGFAWLMQEVPADPTGEYERRKQFVENNLELCKLGGLTLLLVEVLNELHGKESLGRLLFDSFSASVDDKEPKVHRPEEFGTFYDSFKRSTSTECFHCVAPDSDSLLLLAAGSIPELVPHGC